MKVFQAKTYQGLSLCLVLSIFVITLTSCNNGNLKAVVQETELISTQLTATKELTLVPETEVVTQMPTIITLTSEPTKTKTPEPTATVEATSVKFSKEYPVLWSEGYIANVGGMEIPIAIGLTFWVMNRPDEPITEIHIAEDMVDNVGEYFMRMCFWRYTKLMDHPEVTYEQYLELVAKGEGKIEVATYDEDKPDQEVPEVTLIDPRKGFSFAFVDDDLPIEYYMDTYRFGSSKEKILLLKDLSVSIVKSYYNSYGEKMASTALIGESLANSTLSILGYMDNQCIIREKIVNGCSLSIYPGNGEFEEPLRNLIFKPSLEYKSGIRSDPPFWLVQEK